MSPPSLTSRAGESAAAAPAAQQARRIVLSGDVQGHGVRPAVARHAARWGLSGFVTNTVDGVWLEVAGDSASVARFCQTLADFLPAAAKIGSRQEWIVPVTEERGFQIRTSAVAALVGTATMPRDRGICDACLAEVLYGDDRRRAYPFTSCTACGPRYSIIASMPYERSATSMEPFLLCPACEREYREPADRRFHAETNACADCGPQVRLSVSGQEIVLGSPAVERAAAALKAGSIVAVAGIGGYQLLCDATSATAVSRLRARKRRPEKPLAVLCRDLAAATRLVHLTPAEQRWLADAANPIVLCRRHDDAALPDKIAPALHELGLLLPTTGLHALLCQKTDLPLVCTSGNVEGEPLAFQPDDAEQALTDVADLWLHHDRPILRPIDDSVVRMVGSAPCILRLGRGLAPLRLPWPDKWHVPPLVALGGEQKAALALWNGRQAVLGPHLGDLTNVAACQRWEEQLRSWTRLYGVELSTAGLAHDLHPDYFSSRWSARHRQTASTTTTAVQHHHAHVAAVLWEHALFDRPALGLAWDGSGLGTDGTIWGGETLVADLHQAERLAHLRPFLMFGGERAIREPWRIAVALVADALGSDAAATWAWPALSSDRRDALLNHLALLRRTATGAVVTSSMGRLFDGVAALVLADPFSGEEGRPAQRLEQQCDFAATGAYSFSIVPTTAQEQTTWEIDWRPVIAALCTELRQGLSPAAVAMRFHRAVADLAQALAALRPDLPLVTGGGVFQNAVLGQLLEERLADRSAGWLRPRTVPAGDGGLAVGQLAVAAARWRSMDARTTMP